MPDLARDVLDEADNLGLAWWEHLALILAMAILRVLARRSAKAVTEAFKSIDWTAHPAPEPISDGGLASDREIRAAGPYEVTDPMREIPGRDGDGGMG